MSPSWKTIFSPPTLYVFPPPVRVGPQLPFVWRSTPEAPFAPPANIFFAAPMKTCVLEGLDPTWISAGWFSPEGPGQCKSGQTSKWSTLGSGNVRSYLRPLWQEGLKRIMGTLVTHPHGGTAKAVYIDGKVGCGCLVLHCSHPHWMNGVCRLPKGGVRGQLYEALPVGFERECKFGCAGDSVRGLRPPISEYMGKTWYEGTVKGFCGRDFVVAYAPRGLWFFSSVHSVSSHQQRGDQHAACRCRSVASHLTSKPGDFAPAVGYTEVLPCACGRADQVFKIHYVGTMIGFN